jgi:hypothetical protein
VEANKKRNKEKYNQAGQKERKPERNQVAKTIIHGKPDT